MFYFLKKNLISYKHRYLAAMMLPWEVGGGQLYVNYVLRNLQYDPKLILDCNQTLVLDSESLLTSTNIPPNMHLTSCPIYLTKKYNGVNIHGVSAMCRYHRTCIQNLHAQVIVALISWCSIDY